MVWFELSILHDAEKFSVAIGYTVKVNCNSAYKSLHMQLCNNAPKSCHLKFSHIPDMTPLTIFCLNNCLMRKTAEKILFLFAHARIMRDFPSRL